MVGKLYLWHGTTFWECLYGNFAVDVAVDLEECESCVKGVLYIS
jgi:hypothetical protein